MGSPSLSDDLASKAGDIGDVAEQLVGCDAIVLPRPRCHTAGPGSGDSSTFAERACQSGFHWSGRNCNAL